MFPEIREKSTSQRDKSKRPPAGSPFRSLLPAVRLLMVLLTALTIATEYARAEESAIPQQEEGDIMEQKSLTLTILYNNVPSDGRLTTAWGMACLVEGAPKTILFDTGGDGSILIKNMKILGKNPDDVEVVVLSHIHSDHTGGLAEFLRQNSNVQVFLPESFPGPFKDDVARTGAQVQEVSEPLRIMEGVYTTGEMGLFLKEQALVLDTSKGLVVITGCSHPGVDNMAQRAVKIYPERNLYLITGGFHLGGKSPASIEDIIRTFQTLEVQKVGPSHCTGDRAVGMFREAWGDDFMDLGCGAQVTIPAEPKRAEPKQTEETTR